MVNEMSTDLSIAAKKDSIWRLLQTVMDPELPVLSVVDLGIVRDIIFEENIVTIVITPTYTGCPAMDIIKQQIMMELAAAGFGQVRVRSVLSPAWTTDWMTQSGKEKLRAYGIAAPLQSTAAPRLSYFETAATIECPHCRSGNTTVISEFGSTACKALHRCLDCQEPFDYFKCH
jgi:ring-1,2-phenylacetyl-CoA epoxidase subunit PaaD